MKVKNLFKHYNEMLKKHRTVEIIDIDGYQVYYGLISNIPKKVAEQQISSWSTVMDVKRKFNNFHEELCDEDQELASITMYVSVVVEYE